MASTPTSADVVSQVVAESGPTPAGSAAAPVASGRSALPGGSWTLRVVGRQGEDLAESVLVPLAAAPDWVEVCESGCLVEGGRYDVTLYSDEPVAIVRAMATVDGEEARLFLGAVVQAPENSVFFGKTIYSLVFDEHDENPFDLVYGLVRIQLSVELDDGRTLELTSLDIPCKSKSSERGFMVEAMFEDLAQGEDVALGWMFGHVGLAGEAGVAGGQAVPGAGRAAALGDAVMGPGASVKSTESKLAAAAGTLDVFESLIGAVRTQAAGRVEWAGVLTPARDVRRCDRQEAAWVARNPGCLEECSSGPSTMSVGGKRYAPARLMVSTPVRNADTYENGVVLGFLDSLAASLGEVEEAFGQKAVQAEALVVNLLEHTAGMNRNVSSEEREDAFRPVLAAASLGADRLRGLAGRAGLLARRARRLRRSYADCMPGARPVDVARRPPRRTKAFAGSYLYARLWHAMEGLDLADLASEGREGFALSAMRVSRLYELYVLHQMLGWLQDEGFSPSARFSAPIQKARYTVDGRDVADAVPVAGVYRLDRQGPESLESITLYYQPVVHGDMLEEMGVTLHRTTRPRFSDGRTKDSTPFYTPDYLLVYEGKAGRKTCVIDAKCSNSAALTRSHGGGDWRNSIFQNVVAKYMLETVDSLTGKPADAVWLLCADAPDGTWLYQDSPWAQAQGWFVPSGVAEVSPDERSLGMLFAMLGIQEAPRLDDLPPAVSGEASGYGDAGVGHAAPGYMGAGLAPTAWKTPEEHRSEPGPDEDGSSADGGDWPADAPETPVGTSSSGGAAGPGPRKARSEDLALIAEMRRVACEALERGRSADQVPGEQGPAAGEQPEDGSVPTKPAAAEPAAEKPAAGKRPSDGLVARERAAGKPSPKKPSKEAGRDRRGRLREADDRSLRATAGRVEEDGREDGKDQTGEAGLARAPKAPKQKKRSKQDVRATHGDPGAESGKPAQTVLWGKGSLPTRDPEARAALIAKVMLPWPDTATEMVELLDRLWDCTVDKTLFYSQRACQNILGINAPVIKLKIRQEEYGTYVMTYVGGCQCFVYAKPNLLQLIKIRKAVEKAEKTFGQIG